MGTHQGEKPDLKAKEIRATITQVTAGGWKIEPKKTKQRSRHSRSDEFETAVLMAYISQQGHKHQTDSAGKSIHSINEVNQVSHGDQPKDSDENSPITQIDDPA